MAARQSRRQGGGGVVLAVVTILIILLLIAGYVPVIIHLDPYVRAAKELNGSMDEYVTKPLEGRKVAVEKEAVTADRRTPYGIKAFTTVKKYLTSGLDYEDLAKAVGWQGETAIADIQRALEGASDVSLRPATVQQYLQELREAFRKAKEEINAITEARNKAIAEAKRIQEKLDNAEKINREQAAKAEKDVLAERQKKEGEIKELSAKNDKLNDNLQKALADGRTAAQALAAERAKFAKQDEEQRVRIRNLEIELGKKADKVVADLQGEVLLADMIREYAIIGLGRKDDISLGDTVTILRSTKEGKLVPKALGHVVSVSELTSRVNITVDKDNVQYPVIEGDKVVPDKKAKPKT